MPRKSREFPHVSEAAPHISSEGGAKKVGLLAVIAMVISSQVGSSMFLLPKQLAPYGIWGISSWILAGMGALALCQVFSLLAAATPSAGGPHVYIGKAFGSRMAFYTAWSYWVISWLSSLQLFLLASTALGQFCDFTFGMHWGGNFSAHVGVQLSTLLLVMALNMRGLAFSGISELAFSLLKIIPLLVIPFLAIPLWNVHFLEVPKEFHFFESLNASTLLTFWGFVGLEAGTTIANGVKNPTKTVPRGLFWGTAFVLFLYAMNTWSLFLAFPRSVLMSSDAPYSLLLTRCMGPQWGSAISLLIFVICLGTLNSWILASGQVVMTAAEEKLLPAFFGGVNRLNSPIKGICITGACLGMGLVILALCPIQQQIEVLINCSVSFLVVIYALCTMALIFLLKAKKIAPRPWSWMWIIGALVFCLWILWSSPFYALVVSAVIPATGWVLAKLFQWPVR